MYKKNTRNSYFAETIPKQGWDPRARIQGGQISGFSQPLASCLQCSPQIRYCWSNLGTVLDGTYTFPSLYGVHNWPFRRLSILISLFVFQYYYFLKNIVAKSDLDLSIVVLRIPLKQNTAILSTVRPCVRVSQAWHLTFLTYIKA